ncbi:hypothetical protein DERP_006118 [Dermatophagoides pteronyssinus]|uniref:Uncharacterized protein n=1 Tax=Dermatophagoides pteronyssinus TaxID=6956 RepID=A0ABQ8JSC8_DERPT|nr:hypothetical protein DERP_006118 [Dermatophagoides pteronyssinus]
MTKYVHAEHSQCDRLRRVRSRLRVVAKGLITFVLSVLDSDSTLFNLEPPHTEQNCCSSLLINVHLIHCHVLLMVVHFDQHWSLVKIQY